VSVIVALILSILTIIPKIGFLFGLAGIIFAIDYLVKLKNNKKEKGKNIAILAIIITSVIIIIKIFLLTSSLTQKIADFAQLDYEEALIECNNQNEDNQVICFIGLITIHSNDSRVQSGETCEGIISEEGKTACYVMVASLANNTEMCNKIRLDDPIAEEELKNYCLAITTKNPVYCNMINNTQIRTRCTTDLLQYNFQKK